MDLFIYSDESGVFDKKHNEIFVYGGLIFLGKKERDIYARKYSAAEHVVRGDKYPKDIELKACKISNKEKGKLYRSMNNAIRFGVVIRQRNVLDRIFLSKKDKQRYLDYAYKIALKRTFEQLIQEHKIDKNQIETIHIYNDEHTTATNGRYELREGLEQEFKNGTYNSNYDKFYPPVFENINGIVLNYCDSKTTTLIRAADIIANHIYFKALHYQVNDLQNVYLITLP